MPDSSARESRNVDLRGLLWIALGAAPATAPAPTVNSTRMRPRDPRHSYVVPKTASRCNFARDAYAIHSLAVDPAVLPILACPRCRVAAPFADLRHPRCKSCGLEPAQTTANVIDLIDVGAAASRRDEHRAAADGERPRRARLRSRVATGVRALARRQRRRRMRSAGCPASCSSTSTASGSTSGPARGSTCRAARALSRARSRRRRPVRSSSGSTSRARCSTSRRNARPATRTPCSSAATRTRCRSSTARSAASTTPARSTRTMIPSSCSARIRRVLRPGGVYVGSTFAEAPSLLGRLAARAAGIRRFEPGELRAWLQRIGFSRLRGRPARRCVRVPSRRP